MPLTRPLARPQGTGRGDLRPVIAEPAGLAAEAGAWDGLIAHALSPHPYYGRHAVAAHRAHGIAGARASVLTVYRGADLVALLPFELVPDITGLGSLVARPLLSPFIPASAPLVSAGGDLDQVLDALVGGLREASGGRGWRWPLLGVGSPLGVALLAALERAGWSVGQVAAFERPVLDRRGSHDAFLAGHPGRSRLKDLRRRRRRLEGEGALAARVETEGEGLRDVVEAFLSLEEAGWKGAAGTALASAPRTAAFARELFADRPGPVGVRADVLSLDGRPLAISLALVAGGTASLLKTAYDETARAHAPGLLLELEIVRALHETAFADRLDSATLPGSALEGLYPDRETVAEIIAVPPGGAGLVSLDRRVRLARFEHRAKAEAKRLLGRT